MANWTANSNADDNVYISFGGNQSSPDPGDFKFFHEALAGVSKFNVISTLRSSGVDDKPVFFETQEFRLQALKTTMVSGNITPGTGDKGLVWLYSAVGDSKIELYANDSVKLTTKSDGVLITGELESTTLDVNGAANIDGLLDVNTGSANQVAIFQSTDDKAFIRLIDDNTDTHLISKDNKFSIGETTTDYDNFKVDISSGNVEMAGTATIGNIANANTDTDVFLVSASGVVKFRTGAEVRSDIGAGTGDGTVTSVAASTAGDALDVTVTNSTTAASLAFDFAGNNTQYINGAGNLTTLQTIPTVGNGTLTVQGTGVLGGSGTFTANQSGASTISVTHDNSGVTAASYTAATIAVNASGHITSASSNTIPAAANNATITIAGADGIRINAGASGNFTTDQSVAETITVTMDYAGTDNFILGSVDATGTAIQSTDKIIYSDVGNDDIQFGNVSDLPFDNSGGTMSSWNLTGDSGGSAQIDQGETVDIAGGTNITTTRSSNTVTITNDITDNSQLTNGANYSTTTGTVTGTGVSTRLAFWSGTSSLSSDAGLTYNNATDALTVAGAVTWSGGGSTESNSAYDNMITDFTDSGSSTITLTLTQQDGGTLTTSFGNPQGTVTEVGISHTGNAFSVSGTPIGSSGTLAIDMQGTSSQYVNGAGNLITFPQIPSSANNPTITLSAGTGLTGGGSFTLNQSGASTITFNASNNGTVTSVGTGTGLTGGTIIGAGTISVDSTVVLTNNTQTISGDKTFSNPIVANSDIDMESGGDILLSATSNIQVDGDSGVGKFLKSVSTGLAWTTVSTSSGTVTSVSAANPTTGGAVGNPLFISGSTTVNPTVNLVQANITQTAASTSTTGGVSKGTWNANTQLNKTAVQDHSYQGEVVYFGSAGTLAQGKLYNYVGGDWAATDADFVSKSQGLLAIALGTTLAAGMLTRGMYTLSYNPALADGDILYLSPTEGQMYYEPPSGTGDVVRIVGTALSSTTGQIFFHPDNTFIELD